MFSIGQVVYSKCGRDRGFPFAVVAEDGEYVYLVDGKLRPLARPKKKKIKHVQMTYHIIDDDLAEKLESGAYVNDAGIRKALSAFTD